MPKEKAEPYQMGHYLNNRLNLKIGYKYRLGMNVELNYAFLNILEIGLYTGIDRYYASPDPDSVYTDANGQKQPLYGNISSSATSPFALLMGANLNIHILPLFIKNKKLTFRRIH